MAVTLETSKTYYSSKKYTQLITLQFSIYHSSSGENLINELIKIEEYPLSNRF